MLTLVRRHRWFFAGFLLAGLALRLLFFFESPQVTDDSRFYANIATNWLQHGIYGETQAGQIVPSDDRLPGYPAFLAVLFAVFGVGNFNAALLIQVVVDLATCFLIADLARRTVSDRAAMIAFPLATLCPFLANYAAAALTETWEIFFTALALDLVVIGLAALDSDPPHFHWRAWVGSGLAVAGCILLRPDGGILLAGIGCYLVLPLYRQWRAHRDVLPIIKGGILVAVFAFAPLVPWTVRNFRTLHIFQPLAPRYATEHDELVPHGFNRWVKTWMASYVSVEEIYWNVPGQPFDPTKLPDRAFDSAEQKEQTLALIADYNQVQKTRSDLDARFAELAAERIRAHPLRYYVWLPALRIADMWLRPRTELLPPDPRWWEFNDETSSSIMAVGFGILNLAYLAAAALALLFPRAQLRYWGLLLIFVLLRSGFLGTMENPEARYTLECYPVVIVLAAGILTVRHKSISYKSS